MTDFITYKPSDWNIKNLENIAKFITKGATPTTYGFEWVEESGDSIPFLRSECVTANGFKRKGMNFISKKAHAAMARSKIKSGDILMTITGNIGRIATLPDEIPEANINQHIAKISVIEGVSSSYVAQSLQQEHYTRYYERILTGQAYPQISLKQVRETPILLPSYPEQQKIAEVLSIVDKKIDLIDQKIAETEKLKTGLMQKLFSEGIGVQDENGVWQPHTDFKPSGYPDCWKVMQLKSIANVITGKTPPPANTENYGGDYMFVSPSDLGSRKYISHTKSTLSKQGVNNGKVVPKGAIFFTCIGSTIGKIGISTQECCTNQQINTVILEKDGYMSEYVYYALSHISGSIKRLAGIQAVPIVKKSLFESQFIPIPPQEEQQLIAETLATVDLKLDILDKQKAETQQLKKGLMQKLLTGEWRVPVEETEAA
ncbi:TPA: restriction endonuclease subunit S [Vibrio parahaemolyticus]|uniref:restriction endonuclease subunit S n=1 Tax=Vibrio sp. Y20_XG_PY13 TaxID=2957761 RepID=UPI0020A38792|nr:restriction endonuclease subunit S [Vibrio sp. Y20_XG_PY13]EGR2359562.1 restriction endonuclease subunit S [Vibrio parahaemolyticus]EGR3426126.1 restriction endonuclease subunit S [Vibrio parahaemolyticus]EIV8501392.1 restriction endonuclease subunit S [Vibrio parahaemolyticus]EIV8502501.1 restriction endonuclease subunit S [Vibrio parahaemolyticus]HCE1421065.1 restriction endonuclease subunit S [Vibrio parahaemolyticus]